jgi:hypothetical protein
MQKSDRIAQKVQEDEEPMFTDGNLCGWRLLT